MPANVMQDKETATKLRLDMGDIEFTKMVFDFYLSGESPTLVKLAFKSHMRDFLMRAGKRELIDPYNENGSWGLWQDVDENGNPIPGTGAFPPTQDWINFIKYLKQFG